MGHTLYRVRPPGITEVYGLSWGWTRGSGGIGAGIYAFRDREPAEEWAERKDAEVFEIENALENPITPTDLDTTRNIHRFMAQTDRLVKAGMNEDIPEIDLETIKADPDKAPYHVSLSGSASRGDQWERGDLYASKAFNLNLNVGVFADRYGIADADTEHQLIRDAIEATEENIEAFKTAGLVPSREPVAWSHPFNTLVWGDADGVMPADGAGGNSTKWGCVIFKERVEECLGRKVGNKESIDLDALRRCWR